MAIQNKKYISQASCVQCGQLDSVLAIRRIIRRDFQEVSYESSKGGIHSSPLPNFFSCWLNAKIITEAQAPMLDPVYLVAQLCPTLSTL